MLRHLRHSSAQLGLAQLGTSCHLGKHSSAQLGSTQLSSAWFGPAQVGSVPVQAELPGRKWHCIQGGLAGGRLPKPEPVPRWDRGNTGHGHRQDHPLIGSPCTGWCPQALLGEHYMGTGLPGYWCLGQPPVPQFPSAQSRQMRWKSLPAAPCDLGPMTPGGSQTISQHPEQAALGHSPTWCNSGAAAG